MRGSVRRGEAHGLNNVLARAVYFDRDTPIDTKMFECPPTSRTEEIGSITCKTHDADLLSPPARLRPSRPRRCAMRLSSARSPINAIVNAASLR